MTTDPETVTLTVTLTVQSAAGAVADRVGIAADVHRALDFIVATPNIKVVAVSTETVADSTNSYADYVEGYPDRSDVAMSNLTRSERKDR